VVKLFVSESFQKLKYEESQKIYQKGDLNSVPIHACRIAPASVQNQNEPLMAPRSNTFQYDTTK